MSSLDALLHPRSVAIIGASDDKTKIGGRPLHYLLEAGFSGGIYPVNPSREVVQDVRAFAAIGDVPVPVDCAIIATPTATVLPAVQACADKGVKAVVIYTSGFAEMGDEGQKLQGEILRIARAHGTRIVGPNCLGLFNTASNAFLSFSGACASVIGSRGRVGLVSQSGGYAGDLVSQARRIGLDFGSWITTGNEADVEAGEVIGAFAEDDDTDVIVAYLECARDGAKLIAGLKAARARRKPVIIIKAGNSQQGALAVAAHTAALAGADAVYDAVFARYGAYRAYTTEEMLDIAYAASRGVFPAGDNLAVLTLSGGIGVLAADYAKVEGLDMPPLPDSARSAIAKMVPNAGTLNPIDLTAQPTQEPELCARALDQALSSGEYDMAYLNLGMLGGMEYAVDRLVESLTPVAARHAHIPVVIGTMASPEVIARYEGAGYLQFLEPAHALRALKGLHSFSEAWSRNLPEPHQTDCPMPKIIAKKPLSEAEAKRIIAAAGIPVPAEVLAKCGAEAATAAEQMDGPIAIKVVSADILHKTELGGVVLDIPCADVGQQVEAMQKRVSEKAPNAHIEGFLITPMLKEGVECFIGTQNDPVFGVSVTFGLGGTAVELYRDVTTRIAPIDRAEALDMINSTKGAALLKGFRGRAMADVDAVADAIVAICALAQANSEGVGTIEINPLLALDQGKGVVALDAVISP